MYPEKAIPDELSVRARRGNVLPVALEMPADTLTPVSAFLRLHEGDSPGGRSFLIESVEQGERISRYSYLGIDPIETLSIRQGALFVARGPDLPETRMPGDPFEAIRRHLSKYRIARDPSLPPFQGGAVGYVGFGAVKYFEPSLASHIPAGPDPAGEEEAVLLVFGTLVAFDHLKSRAFIIANLFTDRESLGEGYERAMGEARALLSRLRSHTAAREVIGAMPSAPAEEELPAMKASLGRAKYIEAVKEIKKHIGRGDIFQCVLSDRFEIPVSAEPFAVYRALRQVNPSPYQFYIGLGEQALLGASPEMLVRSSERLVETHPIAGTRPRGKDESEDKKLERDLLRSVKEKAEHLMLVDLGRNDLGRVCAAGTVSVREFMQVQRFSHVMHLTSLVQGDLKAGKTAWDAFGSCFPAGTLTGAPKIRAIQILSALERAPRGFYGGAVLRYDFSGDLDSCIAIRSLMIRGGVAHVQAGAGIVADSRPESEYREVLHKMSAVRRAIALGERMEERRHPGQAPAVLGLAQPSTSRMP